MQAPLHAFAHARQQAATELRALAAAISVYASSENPAAKRLGTLADRTANGSFRVLLLGAFSSGKSSLVNALLGQSILPVKVNPCTAILTEVTHGEQAEVRVSWHDGATERLTPAEFIERFQLQTSAEDVHEEHATRFGQVRQACVYHPSPILRDGVTLLDTPGLDDDDVRTQRTLTALPDADAVVVVLNAVRFLTDVERQALRRHLAPLGLQNLFFAVTMNDLLPALTTDPDAERARIWKTAQSELLEVCHLPEDEDLQDRFFLLDARTGLAARWDKQTQTRRPDPDAAALESSGLAPFEASLHRFLVHERGAAQLRQLLATVETERARLAAAAELDAATSAASLEELRQRRETLQPRFAKLEAIAERVGQRLEDFISRQEALAWADMRDFLEATIDTLPGAVMAIDLGSIPSLRMLGPGGRETVAEHLRTRLQDWLEERIQDWQRTFRLRLRRALEGLSEELQPEVEDFDSTISEITAAFAGAALHIPDQAPSDSPPPSPERWLSVALGAALLSPGAMAAGWSEGLDGVTLGAASRLGARVAVITMGTLLGPVGQASLLLYAAADTAMVVLTGDRRIHKLQRALIEQVEQSLRDQQPELRQDTYCKVRELLTPLREDTVTTIRAEAEELRTRMDAVIQARERTLDDAAQRAAAWQTLSQAFEHTLAQLQVLTPARPS